MLRTTSRLQALSRTLNPQVTPRTSIARMSANMTSVTAKDACPREFSVEDHDHIAR